MSIEVMSTVWKRAPLQGGDLLILLALADNADDNGNAYPGIPYLARKARMTDRNAQRCVQRIADSGFLKIIPNAGPSGANKYQINLAVLCSIDKNFTPSRKEKGGEILSPPTNCHPVTSETEGVTSEAPGGDAGVTLTVIEPSEEPLKARECAREAACDEVTEDIPSSAEVSETVDRKAQRRAFQAFVNNWPGFAGMSLQSAEREWMALDSSDKLSAASKRDAWISLLRKQGKDHTPAPSTYLKQRLWEAVSDQALEGVCDRTFAAPFGKLWMQHVLKAFEKGPGPLGPMPAFIAKQIAEGSVIGQREQRDRQARHGFPEVNFMFHQAADFKGHNVPTSEVQDIAEMEAIAVDAPTFDRWRIAFAERGWPWMQVPKGLRFVWMPVGGPDAYFEPSRGG